MLYHLDLIGHFLSAHSRHGTHSPFVYKLASQVIYSNKFDRGEGEIVVDCTWNDPPRYLDLVKDILVHLDIYTLKDHGAGGGYWADFKKDRETELISRIENGQLLVVHEPHLDLPQWRALTKYDGVTVSIDLFHFGLVLKRAGQHKENFSLRFPYWRCSQGR